MTRRLLTRASLALVVLPAVIAGGAQPASAAKSITVNCAHHSLQHAINRARAGGTVLVKGHCVGRFTIRKNLTIKGDPRATLDARRKGPVVTVAGKRHVALVGLTVTHGKAKSGGGINVRAAGSITLKHVSVIHDIATGGAGGGIAAMHGGALRISHSTVSDDISQSPDGSSTTTASYGGGIFASGRTTIIDSTMTNDLVDGRSTQESAGNGGAIYATGPLTIKGSTMSDNRAESSGDLGSMAQGGAVDWAPTHNDALVVQHTTVLANQATVDDTYYTVVHGGALYLDPLADTDAVVQISSSNFVKNAVSAQASVKPITVEGGTIAAVAQSGSLPLTVSDTTIQDSALTAKTPSDINGYGGAIYLNDASLSMTGSTVDGSSVTATSTDADIDERGGAIDAENIPAPVSITSSTIANSELYASAPAGDAHLSGGGLVSTGTAPVLVRRSAVYANSVEINGAGGPTSEFGAGLDLGSTATDEVVDSTVASNGISAFDFDQSAADSGDIGGGGIAAFDTALDVRFSTIAENDAAIAGPEGGGGIYVDAGSAVTVDGSVVASNDAEAGEQCLGMITSGGYNVYSTSSGCTWTAGTSDQVVTDPKLGTLGSNGGPTWTIPLESGSPAIDLAPVADCDGLTVDQRGVKRPQGPNCDAGAYEKTP